MSETATGGKRRADNGVLAGLNRLVTRWLAGVSAFVLAFLAVVTFIDVFLRYVFALPFTFSVEMTEQLMGVIVYLAVGLTTHEHAHVSVDLVVGRLRRKVRAALAVVVNLLGLAFLCVVVWRLALYALSLFEVGVKTQILFWPIWPVAFVMTAGSVFFLTGFLIYIRYAWRDLLLPADLRGNP